MSRVRAALALAGVHAGYGRTEVLRGVSLTVPPGKIVGLLGANGVGKTTLLRVAAALVRPAAGEVSLGTADVTRLGAHQRARSGVCLIPEGRGIFRSLSVRDNLRMFLRSGAEADLGTAVDAFPVLGRRMHQRAGTLSGGEQQMLAVAKAFLCRPAVVLADELSLGLAPKVIEEIYAALRLLNDQGVGLLVVEQYVQRIVELADSLAVLSKGQVAWSGPAGELDEQALLDSYLGTRADSAG
ncbi:ABC transporter ATP-binding protein [Amycolatopsis jejuensis]|uniref:ABC transporter ATP-binding protein n=1 Tax=Amycolatopsis jejuensis TaxID=330084 RepID=UPI000526534F|nr:ABC transporter ATP-binding protein [Amycolatopsis jejuensis]